MVKCCCAKRKKKKKTRRVPFTVKCSWKQHNRARELKQIEWVIRVTPFSSCLIVSKITVHEGLSEHYIKTYNWGKENEIQSKNPKHPNAKVYLSFKIALYWLLITAQNPPNFFCIPIPPLHPPKKKYIDWERLNRKNSIGWMWRHQTKVAGRKQSFAGVYCFDGLT